MPLLGFRVGGNAVFKWNFAFFLIVTFAKWEGAGGSGPPAGVKIFSFWRASRAFEMRLIEEGGYSPLLEKTGLVGLLFLYRIINPDFFQVMEGSQRGGVKVLDALTHRDDLQR